MIKTNNIVGLTKTQTHTHTRETNYPIKSHKKSNWLNPKILLVQNYIIYSNTGWTGLDWTV